VHLLDAMAQMQAGHRGPRCNPGSVDAASDGATPLAAQSLSLGGLAFRLRNIKKMVSMQRADMRAIDETQGIGDRVPEPLQAALAATVAEETTP